MTKTNLNLNSILIGTSDPAGLARFYEKILGKPDMVEQGWYGWKVGNTFLNIGQHSEVKGKSKEPQRLIINLETPDVKGEFERIKMTGAKIVKEPYGMTGTGEALEDEEAMWIATFADPDGNYFQLVSPWKSE